MKRLLVLLALVAPVTPAFVWSTAAQVPPAVPPIPAGEPDVVPDDGEVNQTFFRRFLSVRNQSPERITAFLQFRGFNPQTRKWEWVPALPTAGQAVALEVEPGTEKVLETVDGKVASSTVRIWATSDNLQWGNGRNTDSFIVPLAATGRREYQAATVETFTYVFAGPQNPDPNIQEPPLPANTVVEFGQPHGMIVADPGDPGNPAVVTNDSPIAQCVMVPLTLTEPVLIPGPLAPPTIPIIRDADLAALSLDVRGNGSFSGTVRNNGPSTYSGGREWFLVASFNNQPFTTVLRGPIGGLRPGMSLFISGSAPLVGRAGRYFLRLTAGDLDEANDSMGITVMPPPQADLALSNLLVANGTASVDVRNNGPSEYSGFFRRCSISDARGVLTAGPIGQVVPPMAPGQQVTLQFPVNNIDPGPGNVLNARLNAGDQERGNDFAAVPLLSTGVASVTRDFAAGQPFVVGRQLQAQITSDNGQLFGSNLFTLSFQTVGKFPRSNSVTGTIAASSGAPQTVQIALPFDPTQTSFVGTLTLTRDADNSNNFANKTFNAVAGTSIADLDIVGVATAGQTASVRIRNNGPDAYNGNRFVTISDSAGNSVASAPVRTGPVAAGQLIVVPLTLNAGVSSGKFHAGFAQTTPDQTIDNNSSNDSRSFVVGGGKPAPIGISPAGTVVVPNVVGLTRTQATAALTGAGLKTTMTGGASTTAVAQNPIAGATVSAGAAVNANFGAATVPANPAAPATAGTVVVPNVVGLTHAQATAALTGAGLRVTMTGGASATAVSQRPGAGTTVNAGAAVNANFGAATVPAIPAVPAPVTVPNVVGLTHAQATAALSGAGLKVTMTSGASATAVAQSPTAGATVSPGASVNVNFGAASIPANPPAPPPPGSVVVPNVVGLTRAVATAALSGAGFKVTMTGGASTTAVAQSPKAGAAVPPGASVNVNFGAATVPANPAAPPPAPAPAKAGLSVSNLQITGNGMISFTLTNNGPVAAAAGTDTYQINATGTTNQLGPILTPAVPANGSIAVTQQDMSDTTGVMGRNFASTVTLKLKSGATVSAPFTFNARRPATPPAGTPKAPGAPPAPATVTVPNVIGLTQQAADAAITAARLELKAATINSDPRQVAASQNPAAGITAKPGDAVYVNFRPPAPTAVRVPNLFGMTQTAATTALTGAGLRMTTTGDPRISTVLSQVPAAGASVKAGDAVTANFANVAVGGPVGAPAKAGLSVSNLQITGNGMISFTLTNNGPVAAAAGTDTYQINATGTTNQLGPIMTPAVPANGSIAVTQQDMSDTTGVMGRNFASTVTLKLKSGATVSAPFTFNARRPTTPPAGIPPAAPPKAPGAPPAAAAMTVPSVVGLTQPAATSALGAARLTMRITGDPGQGNATSQNPAAGTAANPGQVVTVNYPSAPPAPAMVTVPSVVGMTHAAATNALNGVRLTMRSIGDPRFGNATGQNPAAGATATPVSTVTVNFPSPPPQAQRPPAQQPPAQQPPAQQPPARRPPAQQPPAQQPPAQQPPAQQPPQAATPAPAAPTTVRVPSVVGQKLNDASSQLRSAGLAVSTTGNNSGTVVTQNPTAGSTVAKNSTVALTLR